MDDIKWINTKYIDKSDLPENNQQTVNAILIIDGETNGEMLKRVFPNIVFNMSSNGDRWFRYHEGIIKFTDEWWNQPYKI